MSRPSSEEEDYFLALNNNKRGNAINQIVKIVFLFFSRLVFQKSFLRKLKAEDSPSMTVKKGGRFMPRKGENIYKRKDGRWEARYIHHYESGKAKYRSVYADTYAEARVRRQEQLSTPENYLAKGSKKLGTYAEIANLWLGEIRMTVKESTYTRYYRIVETYLLPKLGEEKLVKIDLTRMNSLIQEFLTTGGQRRKGLSAKTVGDILCVWKSIWDFGAERGYPCPDLKGLLRPQKSISKIKILSEDSQKEIEKELCLIVEQKPQ